MSAFAAAIADYYTFSPVEQNDEIGTNLVFGVLADWNLSIAFFFGGGICTLSIAFFTCWFVNNAKLQQTPNTG